jgi:hypothetical protein
MEGGKAAAEEGGEVGKMAEMKRGGETKTVGFTRCWTPR